VGAKAGEVVLSPIHSHRAGRYLACYAKRRHSGVGAGCRVARPTAINGETLMLERYRELYSTSMGTL